MSRQKTLEHIVKTIVEKIDPQRIYLFGSQARGEASEDSDFDILVIADMEGPRHLRNREIRFLFPLRSFGLDVFVYKPEEFEQQKEFISSVSHQVAKEGKLLYDRRQ